MNLSVKCGLQFKIMYQHKSAVTTPRPDINKMGNHGGRGRNMGGGNTLDFPLNCAMKQK